MIGRKNQWDHTVFLAKYLRLGGHDSVTGAIVRHNNKKLHYSKRLEDSDWLYEEQHGLRPGYSCESKIIRVCLNWLQKCSLGLP
jgi:hypothetical protein